MTDPGGRGRAARSEPSPDDVRALRLGSGANCSSVGSVVDTLFLTAAVSGAIFAAICAAMGDEEIRVVEEPAAEEDE